MKLNDLHQLMKIKKKNNDLPQILHPFIKEKLAATWVTICPQQNQLQLLRGGY